MAGSAELGRKVEVEAALRMKGRFPEISDSDQVRHFFQSALEVLDHFELAPEGVTIDLEKFSLLVSNVNSLPIDLRATFLLRYGSSFDDSEAAAMLGLDLEEFSRLASSAFSALAKRPNGSVLIIEDEPVIAMDLESLVRDFGFSVVGVAISEGEAIDIAVSTRPDVILADVQLKDGFTGQVAVSKILSKIHAEVVFVTAYPERLALGGFPSTSYLVTKPFQRRSVFEALVRALLDGNGSSSHKTSEYFRAESHVEGLLPVPAPVSASVIDGKVYKSASSPPRAKVSLIAIDSLRSHHRAYIEDIVVDLENRNIDPSIRRRLLNVARALGQPLSEDNVLAVGVAVDGLGGLVLVMSDQLLEPELADLRSVVAELKNLCEQFPVYRLFREEAQHRTPLSVEDKHALSEVIQVVAGLPDDVIDSELKNSLLELEVTGSSPMSDVAILNSVSNVLKVIAQEVKYFTKDVGRGARKIAVSGIGFIVVALPTGGALQYLGVSHPVEFGVLAGILSAAATAIKATKTED